MGLRARATGGIAPSIFFTSIPREISRLLLLQGRATAGRYHLTARGRRRAGDLYQSPQKFRDKEWKARLSDVGRAFPALDPARRRRRLSTSLSRLRESNG